MEGSEILEEKRLENCSYYPREEESIVDGRPRLLLISLQHWNYLLTSIDSAFLSNFVLKITKI